MRERIVKIGNPKPLVGVLCEPERPVDSHIAVILLNSGVMHRIGSCRMSVKIARAISEQVGLTSVRFDSSGIGDSDARRSTGADFGQMAVAEVREVMDYLQESRGINSFILYGLCSGAFTSCQVGLVDDRVIGIAQIDGHTYATLKGQILYYLPRLLSLARWGRGLRRLLRLSNNEAVVDSGSETDDPNFEVPEFADIPERKVVAGWMSGLVAKNIHMYSIYTGREPTYFYPNQFRDCFPEVDFGELLSLEYLPDASHIISQPSSQKQVINGIVGWLARLLSER